MWIEEGQFDQTITLFDCACTSLKVEAHSEIQSRFLSSISKMLEVYIARDLLDGKSDAIGQYFVFDSSWSQRSSGKPVILHRRGSDKDATFTFSSE